MLKNYIRKDAFIASILGFFAFAWLYPFATFDPDFVHDSFMLVPAIAQESGLSVSRDVAQWHSPLLSYLPNLIFTPEEITIRNLRVVTVAIYSLTAALIYACFLAGISRGATFAASLIWILTANFTWEPDFPLLALPASYMNIPLIVGFLIGIFLIKQIHGEPLKTQGSSIFFAAALGCICVITILIRWNVGLVSSAAWILILVYISLRYRKAAPLAGFGAGFLFAAISFIGFAQSQGTLGEIFQDTFMQNAGYHFTVIRSEVLEPFLQGNRSFLPLALLLAIALGAVIVRRLLKTLEESTKSLEGARQVLIVCTCVGVLGGAIFYAINRSETWGWNATFMQNIYRFFFWLLAGAVILVVAVTLVRSLYTISRDRQRKNDSALESAIALSLQSLAALAIMVPWVGPRYFWWAAPLGLVCLMNQVWISKAISLKVSRVTSGSFIVTVALIALLASFIRHDIINLDRSQGPGLSALRGMSLDESLLEFYDRRETFINQFLKPNSKALFLCHEGIYAIKNGRYVSHNKYYLYYPLYFTQARISFEAEEAIKSGKILIVNCDHQEPVFQSQIQRWRTTYQSHFQIARDGFTEIWIPKL